MRLDASVPRAVVGAGVLIGLQGLGCLVIAIAVLSQAETAYGAEHRSEASFLVLGAAVIIGFGIALVLGKRGIRSHAIVAEILQLGIAVYLLSPWSPLVLGISVGSCVWVLYLLLNANVRDWALDRRAGP
jgi:Na+/phosphate symporter